MPWPRPRITMAIVEADIGLKGQRIAAIGKAGNPDVMPAVWVSSSARGPRTSR